MKTFTITIALILGVAGVSWGLNNLPFSPGAAFISLVIGILNIIVVVGGLRDIK